MKFTEEEIKEAADILEVFMSEFELRVDARRKANLPPGFDDDIQELLAELLDKCLYSNECLARIFLIVNPALFLKVLDARVLYKQPVIKIIKALCTTE